LDIAQDTERLILLVIETQFQGEVGGGCTVSNDESIFKSFSKVFKNREALSHRYIPDKLLHREKEIETLAFYFSFALQGSTPPNVLILGKTGTGKTAVTKKVLSMFRKEVKKEGVDVLVGYGVATKSPIETLVNILKDMGAEGIRYYRGLSMSEVKLVYEKFTEGTINILVIDEIDKLVLSNKADELLYYLTRRDKTAVIAISNKLFVEEKIADKRVQSSWRPRKLVFKDYDVQQLKDILKYRAELSFNDGVVDDEIISLVSAFTVQRGGDVRFALDILAMAGELAVLSKSDKVTIEHVKEAVKKVESEYIEDSLSNLSTHHKLLLLTVALRKSISPSEAYRICNEAIEKFKFMWTSPITHRRWADYRSELELLGFLELTKRGMGKGKGWEYMLKIPDVYDLSLVVKFIKKDISRELEDKTKLNALLEFIANARNSSNHQ